MPQYENSFAPNNTDVETNLAIAYDVYGQLGWAVKYAGDAAITGSKPTSWGKKGQQVTISCTGPTITIKSEMVNNEMMDIAKSNKKNTDRFIEAFSALEQTITPRKLQQNTASVKALRETTRQTILQDEQEREEVDKAMNLSGSSMYVTYAIIAINTLVFILMAVDGAGIMVPEGLVHIKWGSNFAPLTLTGDWWRLISNTFIHFGVIHLAMNMYCLFTIGSYLEPMLGKLKYTVAYLSTGILASLVSLWWHTSPTNSAGASGAVFGLYGLFLALLTTDLIPKRTRVTLLQSIGIFIVFNLAYGMKGGVDNAAHAGGLLSGFIFGYLYALSIRTERRGGSATWAWPIAAAVTIFITIGFLQSYKSHYQPAQRQSILAEIKDAGYKDNDRYDKLYNDFSEAESRAIDAQNNIQKNTSDISSAVQNALVLWGEAEANTRRLLQMDVAPEKKKRAGVLLHYTLLRKDEVTTLGSDATDSSLLKLSQIRKEIQDVTDSLR